MAVLEEALISLLKNTATVSAVVGARVFPFAIAQNATLPCITVERVSTPRMLTHSDSGATGTLAHSRFQIDSWAETAKGAKQLADIIRAVLNGKTGSIGTAPNTVTVRVILIENEVSEWSPDVEIYRMICDYVIWQEE